MLFRESDNVYNGKLEVRGDLVDEQVRRSEDMIYITIKNANKSAFTEYDEGLYELLKSTSWHKKSKGDEPFGYVNSNRLGMLHRVVMKYWYGEEQYNKMLNKGYKIRLQSEGNTGKYIVEHTNNNGFDCRISNLYFYNTIKNFQLKGKHLDIMMRDTCIKYPLSIFNKFQEGKFQITIGFNCLFSIQVADKNIPLQAMKLMYKPDANYDIDYTIVLNDAEKIIELFINNQSYSIKNVSECIKL